MRQYQVIFSTVVPNGTALYLSTEQSGRRLHALEPLPQLGWFRSTKELSFKAGEILGFEVLPPLLKNLQPMKDEKSDKVPEVKTQEDVLLSLPLNLTFLEQIAWRLIQTDGQLTIKAYQKHCREVSRRSLQRTLKGMVNKKLLIREGATRQVFYRFGEKKCK